MIRMTHGSTEIKESSIQTRILQWLRQQPNSFVWKAQAGPYQRAGLPDIMAVIDGRFYAIEVKRPGGKATRLQTATMKAINAAGGKAFVAWDVTDVMRTVSAYDGN